MTVRTTALLLPTVACLSRELAAAPGAWEFFVTPDGADAAPGTKEQPFAALGRARDAIRRRRRGEALPNAGAIVWLRGRVYRIRRTFERIGLCRDEHRETVPVRTPPPESRPVRDPKVRSYSCDFGKLQPGFLPGQGGWAEFGPGPGIRLTRGEGAGAFSPGVVTVATGRDSWATAWHGVFLDASRDLTLEVVARLPEPLSEHSFFEVYLNRDQAWDTSAMGLALVGGAEGGLRDAVGGRRDAGGPRVVATERLTPGHWVHGRLHVPAGTQSGTFLLRNLSTGEETLQTLSLADGPHAADLTTGAAWSPPLSDLDALVLRLGSGAQVSRIELRN